MDDEVTVGVEYTRKKIWVRLRAELIKQGLGLLQRIPARLLLVPDNEEMWKRACQHYAARRRDDLLEKDVMLALTILHPPVYHIVQHIEPDELKKQGMKRGLGAVANRIIHEWELQGGPKAGPVGAGRVLIMMEGRSGSMCLRTERRKGELLYMVTRTKRKQEKYQGDVMTSEMEG